MLKLLSLFGVGATIRTHQDMHCLPCAGFLGSFLTNQPTVHIGGASREKAFVTGDIWKISFCLQFFLSFFPCIITNICRGLEIQCLLFAAFCTSIFGNILLKNCTQKHKFIGVSLVRQYRIWISNIVFEACQISNCSYQISLGSPPWVTALD